MIESGTAVPGLTCFARATAILTYAIRPNCPGESVNLCTPTRTTSGRSTACCKAATALSSFIRPTRTPPIVTLAGRRTTFGAGFGLGLGFGLGRGGGDAALVEVVRDAVVTGSVAGGGGGAIVVVGPADLGPVVLPGAMSVGCPPARAAASQ